MTAATLPLAGTEFVPLVQGGANVKTPVANINGLTLTASEDIAAGTAVSVNASGDAVQAWGPAPQIAGTATLFSGENEITNPAQVATAILSDSLAVVFAPTLSSAQPISIDVSTGVVTPGVVDNSSDVAANIGIFGPLNGFPTAARLNDTALIALYGNGGTIYAVGGTFTGSGGTLALNWGAPASVMGSTLGSRGAVAVSLLPGTNIAVATFTINTYTQYAVAISAAFGAAGVGLPGDDPPYSSGNPVTPGTGYVPGSVSTIAGGTGTPAQLTVTDTQLVSAAIVNPGSSGTPGPAQVIGTTGVGSMFVLDVTIGVGGSISSIDDISIAGDYTTNPTDLSAEPVADISSSGITGAVVSVVMGALFADITTVGDYTNQDAPTNPTAEASNTGGGVGATWDFNFSLVLTVGTPASLGVNHAYYSDVKGLTDTKFVASYSDFSNSGNFTAVVGTVAGDLSITLGTPGAASFAQGSEGYLALISPTVVVGGCAQGVNEFFGAAVGTISGTDITFGTAASCPIGTSLTGTWLAPLGENVLIQGPLGAPQIATVAGTDISIAAVQGAGDGLSANAPTAGPMAVLTDDLFVFSDSRFYIYEGDGSGIFSPEVQHQFLTAYWLYPLDATHALALLQDLTTTSYARVIKANSLNKSPPIGLTAAGATNGNPVTIQNAGVLKGLSGLTADARYYANGDGTLTTANTGHLVGTAISSTAMAVNVQ